MPLLRADRLKLMYGANEVLSDLTFQLEPRQRLGIVGANGSGKSSLLKAISGDVTPAAGSLTLAPRTRTAYLAQELEAGPHESVYADALHSRPDILSLRGRLEGLEAAMARASEAEQVVLVEDYGSVQHEYERLDGYAYDNRVAEVLHGVGLTEADQALAPGALSGGQRRRLALAKLLLQDADLLLLDEPTNHLDLDAIEWLEGFLRLSRAGMLIVSHDRRFLEHTTDDILELQAGLGEWYPGNYQQYVRLRRERRAVRQKEYEAQQDYIARTEEFIRATRPRGARPPDPARPPGTGRTAGRRSADPHPAQGVGHQRPDLSKRRPHAVVSLPLRGRVGMGAESPGIHHQCRGAGRDRWGERVREDEPAEGVTRRAAAAGGTRQDRPEGRHALLRPAPRRSRSQQDGVE